MGPDRSHGTVHRSLAASAGSAGRGEFIRLAPCLQTIPMPRQARWCRFGQTCGVRRSVCGSGWAVPWRMNSPLQVSGQGLRVCRSGLIRDAGGAVGWGLIAVTARCTDRLRRARDLPVGARPGFGCGFCRSRLARDAGGAVGWGLIAVTARCTDRLRRARDLPVGANSFAWRRACRPFRCRDKRGGADSAKPVVFVAAYAVLDGPCHGE